ncbi:MAG: DNA polymerase IV [Burkholderiaceae bacterium]|jgi:DNA polymerase-4
MEREPQGTQRKIIHSDCDCFYAAIETRDQPMLRGKPVAVGGRPDQRGVVASCNYEARATGVRSAMPMSQALRRCPDLVIIRPAMEKYRMAAREIFAIYRSYTELVEPLSLDEAFLDVTGAAHCRGSATLMAREIKERVRAHVGITVSAGVAPNKFLAKIASAWQKPDGLFVIEPEAVAEFVAGLPVEKLFGVGAVTAAKLRAHGLVDCGDVRRRSRLELRALVGILGDRLFELAQGIDPRAVSPSRERKSLSVEETYVHDLLDLAACETELCELVARLQSAAQKLEPSEAIDRIFVKIRFDDFRKTTVERTATELDFSRFSELLATGFARVKRPVRLLGVGARITPASSARQIPLFESGSEAR